VQSPERFQVLRDAPIVYMVMRDRFDLRLWRAAEQAGARASADCAVSGMRRRGAVWTLETTHGDVLIQQLEKRPLDHPVPAHHRNENRARCDNRNTAVRKRMQAPDQRP
jgi:flavin-dependent dehydrogenase